MDIARMCQSSFTGRIPFLPVSNGCAGAPDDAALGHGYESQRGFREAFRRHCDQPPRTARAAGCLRADTVGSPLGTILLIASDLGLCRLSFGEDESADKVLAETKHLMKLPLVPGESPVLTQTTAELHGYFAGTRRDFSVPLDVPGTEFQRRVWNGLRAIPYGSVRSYAELAAEIGCPNGQRAVGMANGANRIAIIIPCHRAVNTGGALGGFSGGLWRKRLLLELERTGRPLAPSDSEVGAEVHPENTPKPPAKTL
jgi:AraC family transcriptional regulator of adaptative response/methylated-DNA-[protein]-cysteine methyltransferase